ncbi:SMP-30/gluconolactonase/LRE family protein [Anaeromicrobium sediminis]|uniref:SMP-30/Gluconolactonase/LRE-like region domain-containing protein n=1 Tax=Anaeromicrobium sediminis TaxID=1478221 RepID=A0A267ME92_9FIRM|nr:SMP-30/gluconolactonase/LRE family protein [Anaeromicrobium sediminis]PAB57879.1 hypothetical protein CCE28_17945 [Anaeromicrobium sediminis]
MDITCFNDKLWDLIDDHVECEVITKGFKSIEGPAWDKANNRLLFNDATGEKLYEWTCQGGTKVIREQNHMANGNAIDEKGNIISCEHKTSRLVKIDKIGNEEVLASHYDKLGLNSPTDVVIKSDGAIYFTDPNLGRTKKNGSKGIQELFFQGIYKYDPKRKKLDLLIDNLKNPNGIVFSKDESKLFVSDTNDKSIWRYKVDKKGDLTYGEEWVTLDEKDIDSLHGLEINDRQDLICATTRGLLIFDRNGKKLGLIKLTGKPTNMAFGDGHMKSLYITLCDRLCKINMKIGKKHMYN